MGAIADRFIVSPPRCVATLHRILGSITSPYGADSESIPVSIGLNPDERLGRVLGYPLSKYSPAYSGPPTFLSPLTVEWALSGTRTPVFDSKTHGYHAEIGSTSAQMRGDGEPTAWTCPACNGGLFRVVLHFDYLGGATDLWDDEPELPIENYFNGLRVEGTCSACGTSSVVLAMDL